VKGGHGTPEWRTSAPLFGAEHLLSHSAKVAADDSYKATKFSAKAADRAGKTFVKILF
jgi:hypothetical protein